MEAKTLREICAGTGVSRRTIQGYEKAGLVSASGKNKYGHLLYDQAAEERIRNIRFYQQLGFPVREISGIIDASIPVKRKALKNRIKALKREQDELKRLIEKALKLLDSLS